MQRFRERPLSFQWSALLLMSLVLIGLLEVIRLPAALLLGAMAAAIVAATWESRVTVPRRLFLVAQGLIGCLMARSIGPGILEILAAQWPVFLLSIGAVLAFSTMLGGLLARWKVLPGTTAVWGTTPGAATVMVLMAQAFGGDMRLVAFMQFFRVIVVALFASLISRLWVTAGGVAPAAAEWFPAVAAAPLSETLALAVIGALVGAKAKIPAGPLLVPLFAGIILSANHIVVITLPPWLMAGCYAMVGWIIGLGFSKQTLLYAARALPAIAASTLLLVTLCGGLAFALHALIGTDVLTAYLATSPGGADSIAIIAASSKVDLPFVMAMQTARFLLVMLVGPSLARLTARWSA
jgi:membrane AbrB-like protein